MGIDPSVSPEEKYPYGNTEEAVFLQPNAEVKTKLRWHWQATAKILVHISYNRYDKDDKDEGEHEQYEVYNNHDFRTWSHFFRLVLSVFQRVHNLAALPNMEQILPIACFPFGNRQFFTMTGSLRRARWCPSAVASTGV